MSKDATRPQTIVHIPTQHILIFLQKSKQLLFREIKLYRSQQWHATYTTNHVTKTRGNDDAIAIAKLDQA
jgi:hypothetical protein